MFPGLPCFCFVVCIDGNEQKNSFPCSHAYPWNEATEHTSLGQHDITTKRWHKTNFSAASSSFPAHLPLCLCTCRCAKEWKLAVHLTKDCRQCQLIAAAAATCSRPEALKPFLYLDFMDQRKHHTVWDMLMQTVGKLGLQG